MRNGTLRDDSVGVDVDVALKVMSLDAVKVGCVLECGVVPVEVLHPPVDVRVAISDRAVVALEMSEVDRVKTDSCGVEADVGLSELVGEQVGSSITELLFDTVERLEERANVGLVSLLSGRKTALVDTVVDVSVDPFVHRINLLSVLLRVEGDALVLFWNEFVESVVEVADDFAGLIVDNGIELGVPNDGNSAALRVLGVSCFVELSDALLVLLTRDVVAGARHTVALWLVVRDETPAVVAEEGIDDVNREQVGNLVNTFELTNNQSSVSPRTCKRNDEVVSADLGLVLTTLLDTGAEARFLTAKVTILAGPVGEAILARVIVGHLGKGAGEGWASTGGEKTWAETGRW